MANNQHSILHAMGIATWRIREDWLHRKGSLAKSANNKDSRGGSEQKIEPTTQQTELSDSAKMLDENLPVSAGAGADADVNTSVNGEPAESNDVVKDTRSNLVNKDFKESDEEHEKTLKADSAPKHEQIKVEATQERASDLSGQEGVTSWADLEKAYKDRTHCDMAERLQQLPDAAARSANIAVILGAPSASEMIKPTALTQSESMLLGDMLLALGLNSADIYHTHCLKCRAPHGAEEPCAGWVHKELGLLAPKATIIFGEQAARVTLKSNASIKTLRTEVQQHPFTGLPCIVTFALQDLLRNPNLKADCWLDLKRFYSLIT